MAIYNDAIVYGRCVINWIKCWPKSAGLDSRREPSLGWRMLATCQFRNKAMKINLEGGYIRVIGTWTNVIGESAQCIVRLHRTRMRPLSVSQRPCWSSGFGSTMNATNQCVCVGLGAKPMTYIQDCSAMDVYGPFASEYDAHEYASIRQISTYQMLTPG